MAKFWSRGFSRDVQLRLAFNRVTHSGRDKCTLETFRRLLIFDLAPNLVESLFDLFSEGRSHLSLEEFVSAVNKYSALSPDESVEFLFRLYDKDKNGFLSREEIVRILELSCTLYSVESSKEKLNKWTRFILGGKPELDINALKQLVASDQHLKLRISVFDWFVKNEKPQEDNNVYRLLHANYYKHNTKTVIPVLAFFVITLALAIERYFSEMDIHRNSHVENTTQPVGQCLIRNDLHMLHSTWELWAKIFGKLLNFVSMMVLVLVLRNLITLMRRFGFSRFLPLDHNIYFHKIIGYIITVYSVAHTVCHAANVITLADTWSDVWCILFTTNFPGTGLVKGSPIITGWILLVVLAIMVAFSVPAIRRSGHFQLFFNTHRLYAVYFIVLIIHGPKFWQWLLVPGALWVAESMVKITGFFRKFGRTHVTQAELFSGNTVALNIGKPGGFDFRCGDYLYLNIPKISKYEWHAFTISSAPELDYLTLHIRVVGEWTRALQKMIDAAYQKKLSEQKALESPAATSQPLPRALLQRRHTILFSNKLSLDSANTGPQVTINIDTEDVTLRSWKHRSSRRLSRLISRENPLFEKYKPSVESRMSVVSQHNDMVVEDRVNVLIEGPYGAPSSEFLDSPHPVLVAAGIGVTPFVSIAQSIIYRYLAMKTECPHCNCEIIASRPKSLETLRRVDFIWIVRDFTWVNWFKTVFRDLTQNQGQYGNVLKDLIRIKIFVTSADERVTANNLLLRIALEKENAIKNANLHKLRSNVELGRPNWDRILGQVKEEDADATVFFCGPAVLAKALRAKCLKFELDFRKEVF